MKIISIDTSRFLKEFISTYFKKQKWHRHEVSRGTEEITVKAELTWTSRWLRFYSRIYFYLFQESFCFCLYVKREDTDLYRAYHPFARVWSENRLDLAIKVERFVSLTKPFIFQRKFSAKRHALCMSRSQTRKIKFRERLKLTQKLELSMTRS